MSVVDQSIAHYNLLEHLGAGGLGDVYRARDTKVGRTVALKLLPAETPGTPARGEAFAAAIREASTLSHPNIATLFDAGEYAARSYLAYEFVSGVTLKQEIGGRAVNPRRALEQGLTLVPLKMYFKEGRAKLLLGLCKGKKLHDKRETLKKRDTQRDIERAMRRGR